MQPFGVQQPHSPLSRFVPFVFSKRKTKLQSLKHPLRPAVADAGMEFVFDKEAVIACHRDIAAENAEPAKLPFKRLGMIPTPQGVLPNGALAPMGPPDAQMGPSDGVSVVSSDKDSVADARKRKKPTARVTHDGVAQKAADGKELSSVEFLQAKDWVANC